MASECNADMKVHHIEFDTFRKAQHTNVQQPPKVLLACLQKLTGVTTRDTDPLTDPKD